MGSLAEYQLAFEQLISILEDETAQAFDGLTAQADGIGQQMTETGERVDKLVDTFGEIVQDPNTPPS